MKGIGITLTFCILWLTSCSNLSQNNASKPHKTLSLATPKTSTPHTTHQNETLTKNFVLGKFNYTTDPTFVKVGAPYASKNLYVKKETYTAFKKMYEAARKDGITLSIISGTRNFSYQKGIWERKWKRYTNLSPIDRAKKILEFSAMPSTSRHHWGTDIDLNNLNNAYFENGTGLKIYRWLQKNAATYGFYQVYTNQLDGRTGYQMEKWHWSYLPLAKRYLNYYNANVNYEDINGFSGAELSKELYIIKLYVNGISKKIR